MAWDPDAYLDFADPRHRAGHDLMDRIQPLDARLVVDLGCGPGHLTLRLAGRFPDAEVIGVDTSPRMLERARSQDRAGRVNWVEADLAAWVPPAAPDVIYTNAALHWLDDHDRLLPRLVTTLAPSGALAVQMPRNHDQPSHTCIAATVEDGPWAQRLRPLLPGHPVAEAAHYHSLLSPLAGNLDVWETVYLHALTGDDPVLAWTSGSVLRPLLTALDDGERARFLTRHAARLRRAYPQRGDGVTLFPFRRLFLVARRSASPSGRD
jgi:trans-aconitate 2-methyltransferase